MKNENTLNSQGGNSIYVKTANLRITGNNGSLTINTDQNYTSIYAGKDLTIDDVNSIEANRLIGAGSTLTINKSKVHVTERNNYLDFSAQKGIILETL